MAQIHLKSSQGGQKDPPRSGAKTADPQSQTQTFTSMPKIDSGSNTGRIKALRLAKGDSARLDPAKSASQRIFKFRAIKYIGNEKNEVSGIMVGEDEMDVTRRLQQTDHVIVSIREKKPFEFASKVFSGRMAPKARGGKIPLHELVMFTRQLATMVEAGNPLLTSLEVLREQTRAVALSSALTQVTEEIRRGSSLSDSLSQHPRIWDELYVNLVKAGETSGRLATNLNDLATSLEEAAVLRSEVISAMTYPVISLMVIFGVAGATLLGVIPKFEEIFAGQSMELPWLTRFVLGLSKLLRDQFIAVTILVVIAVIAFNIYRKTPGGKYQVDWIKLRLPVFGPLFEKVSTARVCNTFALMIRSGVSTLVALEISGDAAGNKVYSNEIIRVKDRVREGIALSTAFTEGGIFSFMVGHMLSVGEESGNIDVLLEKLAHFFKEQVRSTIKRLTAAIEPIMIVTMGLVVGTMVLAIFLPIIELTKKGGAG